MINISFILPYQATVQDHTVVPLYEELEGIYSEPERIGEEVLTEDEGIWVDGDAGFAWEDPRMERWRWEDENGANEDAMWEVEVDSDIITLTLNLTEDEEEEEVWE